MITPHARNLEKNNKFISDKIWGETWEPLSANAFLVQAQFSLGPLEYTRTPCIKQKDHSIHVFKLYLCSYIPNRARSKIGYE